MKKFIWVETAQRNCLSARVSVQPRGYETGLSDGDLDPVQQWCEENNCGRRTSFDTFKFKNKQEMTVFLLRWA